MTRLAVLCYSCRVIQAELIPGWTCGYCGMFFADGTADELPTAHCDPRPSTVPGNLRARLDAELDRELQHINSCRAARGLAALGS